MNTEATQEKSNVNSTGERLRRAREQMGLTQQNIAERLCLKLSTVRDLEEDNTPADLASTFLRGYIRSYARLVHIPEEELLPMMAKQIPHRAAKVEPMQKFALGKRRKKRDGWLMIFTWLVVFVVVGLTGAWWWQNHKAAQDDLVSLSENNSSVSDNSGQSIPLEDNSTPASADPATQPEAAQPAVNDQTTAGQTAANGGDASAASAQTAANAQPATSVQSPANAQSAAAPAASQSAAVSPSQTPATTSTGSLPTASAGVSQAAASGNALVMNFTRDCWLEVTDASGKKLFSGIQRSGGTLNLSGTAPYRLKIGAPAAVQIQYQGNPVDLSRFIRSNQVARLTVGAP